LRNLAYYRAFEEAKNGVVQQQMWITAQNNFLDIAVLEWCKLFGDKKAKHLWKNSVGDQEVFKSELTYKLKITEGLFDSYIQEMRTYRDKFVAHLDEENQMNIPNLIIAIKSTQHLYQWLLDREDDCDALLDAPRSAQTFYLERLDHGREVNFNKLAT
jgi:hypothetical protein